MPPAPTQAGGAPASSAAPTITLNDGTQLDSGVVKVMRAIRDVESKGNYQASGDNGTSLGAYQWNNGPTKLAPGQLPTNFSSAAKQFGLDPTDFSPANQNKVAYAQIDYFKKQGLTPNEIDAKWNGAKYDQATGTYSHVNAARLPLFQSALQKQMDGSSGAPSQPDVQPAASNASATDTTPSSGAFFPSSPGDSGLMAGLKAAGNMIPSAFNFAKNALGALNPVQTLENVSQIPQAYKEALAANGGDVGTTIGSAFGSVPGHAIDALGLRPTAQAISGTAGYLTGDRIGNGADLPLAAKAFTEDPFGSTAPAFFAADMAAKGVDSATAAIDRARTASYVKNIGQNVAEGNAIPTPIGTDLSGALDRGVTGAASAVIDPIKTVFGKTPEAAVIRGVAAQGDAVDAAGKIVQGDASEAKLAAKTLPKVNTEGVDTYSGLSDRLDTKIKQDLKGVDAEYAASKTRTKLADLKTSVESDVGGVKASAKINYVDEALRGLQELYFKTKDPAGLARIKALTDKARRQGLTGGEINGIAREYGTEFGSKAFSARTGDPLTSTNAQAFENVRSGVKETARSFLKTDDAKALDKGVSDMLRVKKLVDTMAEKVNSLEQRITKRTVLQKVAHAAGSAFEHITGGVVSTMFTKMFLRSNIGMKTMNSLEIEGELAGRLQTLRQLEGMDDATFASTIAKMLRNGGSALNNVTKSPLAPATVFGRPQISAPAQQ